jgi:hypothetical protein
MTVVQPKSIPLTRHPMFFDGYIGRICCYSMPRWIFDTYMSEIEITPQKYIILCIVGGSNLIQSLHTKITTMNDYEFKEVDSR